MGTPDTDTAALHMSCLEEEVALTFWDTWLSSSSVWHTLLLAFFSSTRSSEIMFLQSSSFVCRDTCQEVATRAVAARAPGHPALSPPSTESWESLRPWLLYYSWAITLKANFLVLKKGSYR